MNKDKFHNKNGTLTAYAFACGYIETYGNYKEREQYALLSKDGCWHVEGRIGGEGFWDCYDTLGEARRAFKVCKHVIDNKL